MDESSASGSEDGPWLRVGEVARRTGLTVRTLHHYDQIGLLVPSGRSSGDYRLYGPADLARLLQIENLKSLGLRLGEVASALDDPHFDAGATMDEHIAMVSARIAAERELLARLRALRDASVAGWTQVLDVIALTQRLRHPDSWVRVRAALDAPESAPVDTLVDALLSERDPAVADTLTWALARHGAEATAPLVKQLRDRDPAVRLRVAHALSKTRDPQGARPLMGTLTDPVPDVAAKAAFALGQIGGSTAIGALADALGNSSPAIADAVTHALATIGPEAVAPVAARLSDPSSIVRVQAADALGLLGDPAAVHPLTAALADDDPSVRFAAVAALGDLDGIEARNAIAGAAESGDARVRLLATRLLSAPAGAEPPR